MKKIETNSGYEYTRLFDVGKDKDELKYAAVGIDEDDNFILHISAENRKDFSGSDEYFIIDDKEYLSYLDRARKNRLVSWLRYKRLLKKAGSPKATGGTAVSFEKITLRISGMRYCEEYEIVMMDDAAELTRYSIRWAQHEEQRMPESNVRCSVNQILDLLNQCRVLSWDGFVGAHPKGVSDGIMFSLTGVINEKKIIAHGSQNFPKHYREFTDGLRRLLD